jgi:hypothetical protein
MNSEEVIKKLESAIIRVCSDIEEKKTGSGVDKLNSVSKLVNSYSRLIERVKGNESDPEDGDPDHYRKISKGLIR